MNPKAPANTTTKTEFEPTLDPRLVATAQAGSAPVDEQAFARGSLVGRYVILGRLGAGAMGVVYGAYDPELDRKVALKFLKSGAGDFSARTRLLREAQAMAKLTHPNVVAVHDVGTLGEAVFVAMEFVQGVTVKQWLHVHERSWREVVACFVAVGRGLAAAHDAGLVHRDLKPENIMIGADQRVRVMDFGLARTSTSADGEASSAWSMPQAPALALELTRTGSLVGTPPYMAPEQWEGVDADARSDQFAYCVALWEAVNGERPFRGTTMPALMLAITQGTLTPPSDPRRAPAWLRRLLERGLSVEPSARWPSMSTLLSELSRDRLAPVRRWTAATIAVVALLAAGAGAQQVIEKRADAAAEHERAVHAEAARAEALRLAQTHLRRAIENLRIAEFATRRFLSGLAEDPRLKEADLLALRQQLLEDAIPLFEQLADDVSDDADLELERGRALLNLAFLRLETGEYEGSLNDAKAAESAFSNLITRDPENRDAAREHARALCNQATTLQKLGLREQRDTVIQRALHEMEELAASDPDDPDSLYELGKVFKEVGLGSLEEGDILKADQTHVRMTHLLRALRRDFPGDSRYLALLNIALINHALVTNNLNDSVRSIALLEEALALAYESILLNSRSPRNREILAATLHNLSGQLVQVGREEEADSMEEEATAVLESLTIDLPSVTRYWVMLAMFQSYHYDRLRQGGRLTEALSGYSEVLDTMAALAQRKGRTEDIRMVVKETHQSMAETYMIMGRYTDAATEYAHSAEASILYDISYYQILRANALISAHENAAAAALLDEVVASGALPLHPQHGHVGYHAAASFARLAAAERTPGGAASRRHDIQAKELYHAAVEASPDDQKRLLQQDDFTALRALVLP